MHALVSPPTKLQLAHARAALADQLQSTATLEGQLRAAQLHLAQVIADSQAAINELHSKLADAQNTIQQTKGVLAPIRRLPNELLAAVFLLVFQSDPKCAWSFASVCVRWRAIALRTPMLWTRIRLQTSFDASPEVIRLWLERSGDRLPLDIEIFARVGDQALSSTSPGSSSRRRPRTSATAAMLMASWNVSPHSHNYNHHHHQCPHHHCSDDVPPSPHLGPGSPPPPLVHSHLSFLHQRSPQSHLPSQPLTSLPSTSRTAPHWAHMALYYLTSHITRWDRFVFRFDRMFASASALQSIASDVPLHKLREFEISCAEVGSSWGWNSVGMGGGLAQTPGHGMHSPYGPGPFGSSAGDLGSSGGPGTTWLPSAAISVPTFNQKSTSHNPAASFYPSLTHLTLQHVPFGYASSLFTHSHLRSLTIRSLPTHQLALHRLLALLRANPNLESLELHCGSLSQAMLPLEPTTLPKLQSMTFGGGSSDLLWSLLDTLRVPSLNSLTLDMYPSENYEEPIMNLLARSGSPKLKFLSLAYNYALGHPGVAGGGVNGFGGGHGGGMGSVHAMMYPHMNILSPFSAAFVNTVLREVEELRVGMTSFEALVGMLGAAPGSYVHGGGIGTGAFGQVAFGGGGGGGGGGIGGIIGVMEIEMQGGGEGSDNGDAMDDPMPVLGSMSFPIVSSGTSASMNGSGANANGGPTNLTTWACPKLKRLAMRNCNLNHHKAVEKLIRMVEKRNPPGVSSASLDAPARLGLLSMIDCVPAIGSDVVQWLSTRVKEVRIGEGEVLASSSSSASAVTKSCACCCTCSSSETSVGPSHAGDPTNNDNAWSTVPALSLAIPPPF